MSNLYERIEELCSQKNITITDLSRESGVNRASFSDLKMGRKKTLATSSLAKIAEYFEVSIDYLVGAEEQKNAPTLNQKDERDIEASLERTLSALESQQAGLMFDGEPLDEETRELLASSLRNSMEMAKKIAKERYGRKKGKN